MLPYWFMFALWAVGAAQAERRGPRDSLLLFFVVASVVTTLFIGLRFAVGGDWGSYQQMYDSIYFLSLSASLGVTDPGYALVNWAAAQGNLGVMTVNLVCAMIFMGGLGYLSWRQPNPALSVLVALPYLIIVVAMGYTRQAAAIGVICVAVADASEQRLAKMVILIGVAALFHKTAILLLPIALVPIFRRNAIFGAVGLAVFAALFVLVLRDSSDRLINNYVQGNYDSQGAAIRVSMNVASAIMFLTFRDRITMPSFQKSFWMTCSVLSIVSVAGLVLASASSGVDRISLYLIPLQSVVFSRLPYILSTRRGTALPSVLIAVIGYAFTVQFVWLNYASNANYWIPYRIELGPSA